MHYAQQAFQCNKDCQRNVIADCQMFERPYISRADKKKILNNSNIGILC